MAILVVATLIPVVVAVSVAAVAEGAAAFSYSPSGDSGSP